MNKKIQNAFLMIFLSICAWTFASESIFPIMVGVLKFLFTASACIFMLIAVNYLIRYVKSYIGKGETVYNLLFRSGIKCSIVNWLTAYRILITPALFIMIFRHTNSYTWLFFSAFITDALDGFLARHWKVTTKLGSRMDSLADDLLFIVAVVAVFYNQPMFIIEHIISIIFLALLFIVKILILFSKHDRLISAMHTVLSKIAAISQAIFMMHCIFFYPNNFLFYATITITMIAIIEEIIILVAFKELKQNVKGLFFARSQM